MVPETDFDFEDLVGEEFDFYGIDDDFDENLFRLDDQVYHVRSDEYDGAGSCFMDVEKYEGRNDLAGRTPIARVVVECDDTIYNLVDLHDGHRWLRFGSDYSNAWLPLFIFDYTPKGPVD